MTDDDDPPTERIKRVPGLTAGQLCLVLGLPLPGSEPPPVKDLLNDLFQIGTPKWRNPPTTPPPPSPSR